MNMSDNGRAGVTLLLVGATGHVGRQVLALALDDPRVALVVAPVRRALPAHPRLSAPIIDFDRLDGDAAWWAADAVICTLGTTIRQAGSQARFRTVDHHYPLAVAEQALASGTRTYVLTSAMGADASSRIFYNRVKGELENDLRSLGFSSLTLVRPGLIGGEREAFRAGERALGALLKVIGPLLPRRWRTNPPECIARELLDAAVTARPGVHVVPAARMTP